MNIKKTAFIAAGALAGVFTFSAGLWSLYPEHRAAVADFGRSIGVIDPLPPAAQPPLVFIRTDAAKISGYQPAAAAQGCSADGKIARLVYRMAITADEQREQLLNHPRIRGNEQKYETLRRETIEETIQKKWQTDVSHLNSATGASKPPASAILPGLTLSDRETGAALQRWLQDRAAELYRDEGLKVSFEVNAQTGLEITDAPAVAPNACHPAP